MAEESYTLSLNIPIISKQERNEMLKKSAQSLPNKPSLSGWTPEQFKNAITKPIFDETNSIIYHINRIAKETVELVLTPSDDNPFALELSNKLDLRTGGNVNGTVGATLFLQNGNELALKEETYKKIKNKIQTLDEIPSDIEIGDYILLKK